MSQLFTHYNFCFALLVKKTSPSHSASAQGSQGSVGGRGGGGGGQVDDTIEYSMTDSSTMKKRSRQKASPTENGGGRGGGGGGRGDRGDNYFFNGQTESARLVPLPFSRSS